MIELNESAILIPSQVDKSSLKGAGGGNKRGRIWIEKTTVMMK